MGNQATSGEKAYKIKLTAEKKLGEGAYGVVYKIKGKNDQDLYAAKFFKVPYSMMN
jgi:serine/threonine protein kinase